MIIMEIDGIKDKIEKADYIIIGAGAGLSLAAGLDYNGERFKRNFREYIEKYNIQDMYSGGFYPFKTLEEKWGYWAKHLSVEINEKGTEVYRNLLKLVEDKDYFVITTNVDEQFQKAGFPENKIYETQGRYSRLQCSVPCCNRLYDANPYIEGMLENIDEDLKVPSEFVPRCPVCGEPLDTNLRGSDRFVEDEWWHIQNRAYHRFLDNAKGSRTVLLEFGIGYNTPTIIRFPFDSLTINSPNWDLVRFNKDNFEVSVNMGDSFKLVPLGFLDDFDLGDNFSSRYFHYYLWFHYFR